MGYTIDFEKVLLPNWEGWDNGTSDIPAKNITLVNGDNGAILISSEGIAVYNAPLDDIHMGGGEHLLEFVEDEKEKAKLLEHLSEVDADEVFMVYRKYLERENSYTE